MFSFYVEGLGFMVPTPLPSPLKQSKAHPKTIKSITQSYPRPPIPQPLVPRPTPYTRPPVKRPTPQPRPPVPQPTPYHQLNKRTMGPKLNPLPRNRML